MGRYSKFLGEGGEKGDLAFYGGTDNPLETKYLEAATKGVPKKLATETAIFSNSYFQRKPLTGCYCISLKGLEPEPPVFENIANHSADFTKNVQSRTYFKCIFNSNIL